MRFSQKAFFYNGASFDFGTKELHVIIDDGRLKLGFSTPYHEIGTKKSIKSFPEKALLHSAVAILMAVAAAYATTGSELTLSGEYLFLAFGVLGFLLLLISGSMRFDATRISIVSGHTILIFHDAQHNVILRELYKRRTSEMLRLYGEVDTLNLPQLELKKFRWLRDEGIISEEELENAKLKIASLSRGPARFA